MKLVEDMTLETISSVYFYSMTKGQALLSDVQLYGEIKSGQYSFQFLTYISGASIGFFFGEEAIFHHEIRYSEP